MEGRVSPGEVLVVLVAVFMVLVLILVVPVALNNGITMRRQ